MKEKKFGVRCTMFIPIVPRYPRYDIDVNLPAKRSHYFPPLAPKSKIRSRRVVVWPLSVFETYEMPLDMSEDVTSVSVQKVTHGDVTDGR